MSEAEFHEMREPTIEKVVVHMGVGEGGRELANAEDIIEAMDLRVFGVGPRTWVHRLTYQRRDKILIVVSVLVFAASTALSFLGVGTLWVPQALLRLAAG